MPGPLVHGHGLPSSRNGGGLKARRELFREDDVQLQWTTVARAVSVGRWCAANGRYTAKDE